MSDLIERLQRDIAELLGAHEELVQAMVDKFVERSPEEVDRLMEKNDGLEREDVKAYLTRIAKVALVKAATKYPLDSEHKFSTYSTWWISVALHLELGISLEEAGLV